MLRGPGLSWAYWLRRWGLGSTGHLSVQQEFRTVGMGTLLALGDERCYQYEKVSALEGGHNKERNVMIEVLLLP